jgi:hypothetical protein
LLLLLLEEAWDIFLSAWSSSSEGERIASSGSSCLELVGLGWHLSHGLLWHLSHWLLSCHELIATKLVEWLLLLLVHWLLHRLLIGSKMLLWHLLVRLKLVYWLILLHFFLDALG